MNDQASLGKGHSTDVASSSDEALDKLYQHTPGVLSPSGERGGGGAHVCVQTYKHVRAHTHTHMHMQYPIHFIVCKPLSPSCYSDPVESSRVLD